MKKHWTFYRWRELAELRHNCQHMYNGQCLHIMVAELLAYRMYNNFLTSSKNNWME